MMLCLGAVGGASFVTPMTAMAAVAQDQVITVKGQVVDDQGEPLIGATVKTKDAKTGAVTDLDGNFEIKVKANATLLVSYLGFKERQIAVRGRAILELSSFFRQPVARTGCRSGLWYPEEGRPYRFCSYRQC